MGACKQQYKKLPPNGKKSVLEGELVGSGKFVNQNTLVANHPRKNKLRRSYVTLFDEK